MIIGVPKEIKIKEYRVGLTPSSVNELTGRGHQVLVQHDAGLEVGFTDENYRLAGAEIIEEASEIFFRAQMIVKVKEPQPSEFDLLCENQILFTYLHLAPNPELVKALEQSGCIAIAYETVTSQFGDLPLLTPMSQVAGRLAIQVGSHCLEKHQGGSGILLGGVPGVNPGNVVVIGGGVVGVNAVRMAVGKEAVVTVIDKSLHRLQELDSQFGSRLNTIFATSAAIDHYVKEADLVVGAVLVPGESAPKLVSREMIMKMRPGSVVVDVAIDQGGCFETSKPTSHTEPTYIEHGVVHYCVTNMPGAVPRTATLALNNATLPFVLALADKGTHALLDDIHLLQGLNIFRGKITHEGVAKSTDKPYVPPLEILINEY